MNVTQGAGPCMWWCPGAIGTRFRARGTKSTVCHVMSHVADASRFPQNNIPIVVVTRFRHSSFKTELARWCREDLLSNGVAGTAGAAPAKPGAALAVVKFAVCRALCL